MIQIHVHVLLQWYLVLLLELLNLGNKLLDTDLLLRMLSLKLLEFELGTLLMAHVCRLEQEFGKSVKNPSKFGTRTACAFYWGCLLTATKLLAKNW